MASEPDERPATTAKESLENVAKLWLRFTFSTTWRFVAQAC